MKIWLRTNTEKGAACGIGVVWSNVVKSFDKLKIAYTLDDPNEKCIELWIGWDFNIEESSNVVVAYTIGESEISSMRDFDKVDFWFFPSNYFVNQQRGDYKVYHWKYGVDPEIFPYIDREWDGKFIFSHVAAIQYRKGTHLVCEAFKRLFANDKDVQLNIMSPGATEAYLMLTQLYRESNIIFDACGSERKDVAKKYNGHCFVFPSLREGWGLTLTEAMATGMPAIVSDFRIFDDQFNDDFGWWVKLGSEQSGIFKELPDIKDLMRKMLFAYENRDKCREKGIMASANCHKYLTWEYGVVNQFVPTLECLIDEKIVYS